MFSNLVAFIHALITDSRLVCGRTQEEDPRVAWRKKNADLLKGVYCVVLTLSGAQRLFARPMPYERIPWSPQLKRPHARMGKVAQTNKCSCLRHSGCCFMPRVW